MHRSKSRKNSSGTDPDRMGTDEKNSDTSVYAQAKETYEDELIDVLFKLQGKIKASGYSLDVNIPEIAIVGSQSAENSSVLENVVGWEFLPQETRKPILIQLFPTSEEAYGIILDHAQERKITDFKLIKRAIDQELSKPLENFEIVSSLPIQLKICAPNVPKLNIVYLPGLETVDSVNNVREMVLEYIRQPECIILAVTPANQDLNSSEALIIAEEVDPKRERTIGVIANIQEIDPRVLIHILENRGGIELSLGFYGISSRSQKHIEQGIGVKWFLEQELKFLEGHPSYFYISDTHVLGTPNLRKILEKTLRSHRLMCLPGIQSTISNELFKEDSYVENLKESLGAEGSRRKCHTLIRDGASESQVLNDINQILKEALDAIQKYLNFTEEN